MISPNYFAVFACAVAALVIGFLWFGPIFGKQWMSLMGMDALPPEKMAEGKKRMPVMAGIQFIAALIMATTLSYILAYAGAFTGKTGTVLGIETGAWEWIGFVAPVTLGMVLWEGKPWTLWAIVAGNWLVTLCTMGVILSLWH